jgi:DNA-binding LytR/AlgR family response regulator
MPDLTGLELVETLQNQGPKVIFTTAYTEFALQSFDYDQVVDYLNKPIRLPRFIKAMERVKAQLELEKKALNATNPQFPEEPTQKRTSLVVKEDKVTHRLAIEKITHIQSWGNYVKIFVEDEKLRVVRSTIAEMENQLQGSGFTRIHKSYLVNAKWVKAIDGNQVLIEDLRLPVGRSYQIQAKEKLGF